MNLLIGSHGVGKTTLLRELRIARPDLYITDGFSRPVRGLKKELKLTDYQEHLLINNLTRWNWINNINSPIYTSTRSIIDSVVYSEALKYKTLSEDYLQTFVQHRDDTKINYFYIPIEFELEDDGIRFIDKEFQHEVDVLIKRFLKDYNIPFKTLKGTVEERLSALATML